VSRLRAAALCALLTGCGLDDYEARMAEAQVRVRRFDEENRQLEGPLEIPPTRSVTVKEGDKDVVQKVPEEIFLRPPRGIERKAKNEARPEGGLLYLYPAKAVPEPPPDPNAAPTLVSDVWLAVRRDEKDVKAFTNDVLNLIRGDREALPARTVTRLGRPPLTFSLTRVKQDKNVTVLVFTQQGADLTLAVAFRIKGPAENSLFPLLDLSLSTLALGEEAQERRAAWEARPPPRPAK
jgi:hypothetical protein